MLTFRPETLVHRVLLKPKVETQTKSGIVLARDERTQAINSDQGEVFMVGPEAWKAFGCTVPPVKPGDKVFYAKYGAKVVKVPDSDEFFVLCNDEDILVGYED